MSTATDLVHLITLPEDATQRLAIFTAPDAAGVRPLLDKIADQVDALGMGDASTEEGRKQIKAIVQKLVKSRTYLENEGERLSAEQKKIPGLIDASRRYSIETLKAMQHKVRAPLTEWEQREEQRRTDHEAKITRVMSLGEATGNSKELRSVLSEARATPVDEETCQEFAPEYEHARDSTVRTLEKKLAEQEKIEADRAELEDLRAAQFQRDQAAELERVSAMERQRETEAARLREEHAAEAVRIVNERRVKEAREADERRIREVREAEEAADRRIQAADAARRAEAERVRLEAKHVQREADRRAADREHRAKVNRAAVSGLVEGGMNEANARRAVELIAQGKVPAVFVAY